jgi:hypothetical protein
MVMVLGLAFMDICRIIDKIGVLITDRGVALNLKFKIIHVKSLLFYVTSSRILVDESRMRQQDHVLHIRTNQQR